MARYQSAPYDTHLSRCNRSSSKRCSGQKHCCLPHVPDLYPSGQVILNCVTNQPQASVAENNKGLFLTCATCPFEGWGQDRAVLLAVLTEDPAGISGGRELEEL